jgi:Succinyl-CoA synthetase, beta subunit
MNLHEYQAKELLKKFNVPVQEGIVCSSVLQAEDAYRQIHSQYESRFAVVKAQIHAGGRGKGKIAGTEQRGVAVGKNAEDVKAIAQNILGGTLVTIQTGPAGKVVNKILIAQDVYYEGPNPVKEFYLSILLDRGKGRNVIMYSTEGGMNIEDVAHDTPDKIFKEWIHPGGGVQGFQARKIAFNLGLKGEAFKNCVRFVTNLYNAYVSLDCNMVEINPLFKTSDDKIIAVDCKMNLDDNALIRHTDLENMRDISEEDPTEVEAGKFNLNFVKLDGNVGCMVNGQDLAMAQWI